MSGGKGHLVMRLRRQRGKQQHTKSYFIIVTFYGIRGSTGDAIDKVGYVTVEGKNKMCFLDSQKIGYWLNQGVTVSPAVMKIFISTVKRFLPKKKSS